MNSQITNIKKQIKYLEAAETDWQKILSSWFRTELTYTSNSLEGNTLSLIETRVIIEDGQSVAGKNLREIYEAQNHANAWDYAQQNLVTKALISEQELLDMHSLILKNIDDQNAGKYRNVPVRISGSNTIFPNPIKVPNLMENLLDWVNAHESYQVEETINRGILAHLKLVKIHPFTDGNGRVSRLLMNVILMQRNLPPIDILPENRTKYLEALEASEPDSPEPFFDFCLQQYTQNLTTYLQTFNN